jgi:hypothetical protein
MNVDINVPPTSGPNAGNSAFIEVLIADQKPSIFAGIMGVASWNVGSRAVAANQASSTGPFAMLALDPSGCAAIDLQGQGRVNSNGNIQVNSTCSNDALLLAGQARINAPGQACNVAGDFSPSGPAASAYNCAANEGVVPIPDPLASRPAPTIPMIGSPPAIDYGSVVKVSGSGTSTPPAGCPGSSTPATFDVPQSCRFPASFAGSAWRFDPGYYPGGINLEGGTYYFEPGIYYIGGGGFRLAGGSVTMMSVASGTTTLGGGILIYNSNNPNLAAGEVVLQGGGSGSSIWPLNGTALDGLVIFHDRTLTSPAPAVRIVGAASALQVRGIIYVPNGSGSNPSVLVEGNGGSVTVDQIIAYRFRMAGNFGTLNVAQDSGFLPDLTLAGLVE